MYSKEFSGQLNAYLRKYLILINVWNNKNTKIKLLIIIEKQNKNENHQDGPPKFESPEWDCDNVWHLALGPEQVIHLLEV